MAETTFDLVVIGGGPGGYVAAIRASQLGLKAAVIERENMGGICLNWGCIPTKALLRSAEVKHLAENAADFGLEISGITFDIKKVVERSRSVASRLSAGVSHLMKKKGITVVSATARLQTRKHNRLGESRRRPDRSAQLIAWRAERRDGDSAMRSQMRARSERSARLYFAPWH